MSSSECRSNMFFSLFSELLDIHRKAQTSLCFEFSFLVTWNGHNLKYGCSNICVVNLIEL